MSRSHPTAVRRSFLAAAAVLTLAGAAAAPAMADPNIDTVATHAIVLDYDTGTVLYAKGADDRMPPASMSKMMTAYTVFSYLKEGKASLDDMLPISEKAWRTQGSKTFVPLGGRARLEDMIRGMVIQSGNDACIVLAEGLAGSEEAFVDQMNKRAREIGLTGTHFANVDGLPNPDEYSTARDLAIIARRLIKDFPEYYHYDSEKDFTYNGIKQGNRNPLLYKEGLGVDGLKTGHTEEAGYGVTVSAIRGDRRIVMVLAGMPSMKARSQESEKLLEWAYREFTRYPLFKAGETIEEADVWLGQQSKVPLTVEKDMGVTLSRAARRGMKVVVDYSGPVAAPIAKGQVLGKLVVTAPDMPQPAEFPVVAAVDVPKLSGVSRALEVASHLLFGRRGAASGQSAPTAADTGSTPASATAQRHG